MPIPGSVHFIVNKATGTVVTLNLEDGKTVTGDPLNRQKNQMWSLIKGEVYWAIQSVATNGYLSVEEHPPVNNDKVVVVEADIAPFTWELCPDGDEYQIIYQDTNKLVDLTHADPDPNTPIIVSDKSDAPSQVWNLQGLGPG